MRLGGSSARRRSSGGRATGWSPPGRIRPNIAADHIAVLQQAMGQLPEPAWGMEILARADSGGATHDFVNELRAFEIRFDLTEPISGRGEWHADLR